MYGAAQETITATFTSTMDATIFSEDLDGANGHGNLLVGRTDDSNLRRGLVQFDLSGIPLDANILSVTLEISGARYDADAISAHRVTTHWGEGDFDGAGELPVPAQDGDATWTHGIFDTHPWETLGGDFISLASATGSVAANSVNIWEGEELIWDVYSWLLGNTPNYGWILIGDETTDGSLVSIVSRETARSQPLLVITYSVPGPDCDVDGGGLAGGPFTFCVDGEADNVGADQITLTGAEGPNQQWVITDLERNILGLPGAFQNVDFDAAGVGSCLIWYLSYDDGLEGLTQGANTNDFVGCYDLSNPIAVNRIDDPEVCGVPCDIGPALLTGGPIAFCVGDGVDDFLAADDIGLFNTTGDPSRWIVTDLEGNILGLPNNFTDVNFEIAGLGTCQVWYLQYQNEILGLEQGAQIQNIEGCFAISNAVTVERNNDRATCNPCQLTGALLTGGPFEFCVGDGVADIIDDSEIGLFNNSGTGRYVVTDINNNILGLPPRIGVVDFEPQGNGVCLIYYVQAESDETIFSVGGNLNQLAGCFALSNPVAVTRSDDARFCSRGPGCDADGGVLAGGPFTFCVGDGVPDMISPDAVQLFNQSDLNQGWIVTDISGNILGLPPTFSVVDFDPQGVGVCLVYSIQSEGEVTGLAPGQNISNLRGCLSLSNPVSVNRRDDAVTCDDGMIDPDPVDPDPVDPDPVDPDPVDPDPVDPDPPVMTCDVDAGQLVGGPYSFCVGDGEADVVSDATLTGNTGANSLWVIADDSKDIIITASSLEELNFDPFGLGTFFIWHLSSDDQAVLDGITMGTNVTGAEGCYDFSTAIQVSTNNACIAPDPDPVDPDPVVEEGCIAPRNIRVQEVGPNSFVVRWDRPSFDFKGYEWEVGYRDEPGSFVRQQSINNRVRINSPWPKPIMFRVRTKCTWTEFSDFSEFIELQVAADEEPAEEEDDAPSTKTGGKSLTNSAAPSTQVATPRTGSQGTQIGAFSFIEESISVYPNPTSDYVNITYSSFTDNAVVELYNYQGQRVRQIQVTDGQAQRVDVSGVPGGIYLMTLRSEGEIVSSEKLLIADR